jgi:hypothetical protein
MNDSDQLKLSRNLRLVVLGLCLAVSQTGSYGHPHQPAQAADGAAAAAEPPASAREIISGTGEFRYQFVPDKLVLPPQVKIRHGHGLCRDKQGRIYFAYEPQGVDSSTKCLVRFDPDGTGATLLGDNALAQGAPHGLSTQVDLNGSEVLYHANNNGTVSKTTLLGEILWAQRWGPQMGNYKPTDAIAAPGSDRLVVADGYGSSMLHLLKTADGIYAGKSWGGTGTKHGEFNTPHGLTYDPRRGMLLIADRGNQRLEYYSTNGVYHSTVQASAITAPCNADVQGDYVLVPDLNGPVVILDKENKAVSVIEVGKVLGDKGFKHPHDAIWLENGDIVVCTWNPGRLGYWKKVGAN